MFKVLGGVHPPRPSTCLGIPALDSLWEFLRDCWEENTQIRPTAPQIVERLIGPSVRAITTSSMTDWDETFTSKFRSSLQAQPLLPSVNQIEHMLFGDGEFSVLTKSVDIF